VGTIVTGDVHGGREALDELCAAGAAAEGGA
jgi:hypothetical protein